MDFLDLVRKRRSIRKYEERPVTDDDLSAVLEAARLAPSWANKQCWRFIVVRDEKTKNEMVEGRQWIAAAPVVVVFCADPEASGVKGDQQYYMLDVGIAMEHLVLAAAERGLGTCWIGWFEEEVVRNALDVPRHLRVVAYTPVGYPAETKGEVTDRKPLSEICFLGKYGKSC